MTLCLTAPAVAIAADAPPSDYPSTFTISIPDPRDCIPARARGIGGRNKVHPLYAGSLIDASPITSSAATPWTTISLESVEPDCAVTFNRRQSSFAGLSVKTGRMMSGLGPHELAIWRELEANPRWVEFDLQRIRTSWSDGHGSHSYTGDWVAVDDDGLVHAGEMKASASYYADPAYSILMEEAASAYARVGITFSRDTGDGVRGGRRRQLNVGRAFGDRFTSVPEDRRDAVLATVEAAGGTAPLGEVEEAAHADPRVARAMVNAMMCARDVAYPLDGRLDRDTPVTRPRTPDTIPDIRAIRHELTNH